MKGKGQPQGGKGKGPGKGPASASAVRLVPVLETAYQLYLAGRRPDQPRCPATPGSETTCGRTPPSEQSSEAACRRLTAAL